jgi:diacylglycerol kinase family enzyme
MEVSLFHNPKSGDGDWSPDRVIRLLEMSGFAPIHCSTRTKELEKALEKPRSLVVIAGGDGAVAEIVLALHGRPHTIAILPTGGSNNIARSLGVFDEPRHIAARLTDAKHAKLRIGAIQGPEWTRNFVESVGAGAFPTAIGRSVGAKEHGTDLAPQRRSDLAGIIAEAKPVLSTVTIDSKRLSEPALMLEIMNIPMVGPNLLLAPEADPAEAALVVAYLPVAKRKAMLAWLKDPESSETPLRRIKAERVEIHPHGEPLHVDDALVEGGEATLVVTLEDKPLTVLIPRDA